IEDAAVREALKTVEQFVLATWPYPAFAMTDTWDLLLANAPGAAMFSMTPEQVSAGATNLFDLVLNPDFRARCLNWPEVGAALYGRMRAHAAHNPEFATRLEQLVADGSVDPSFEPLTSKTEI